MTIPCYWTQTPLHVYDFPYVDKLWNITIFVLLALLFFLKRTAILYFTYPTVFIKLIEIIDIGKKMLRAWTLFVLCKRDNVFSPSRYRFMHVQIIKATELNLYKNL